MKKVKLILLLSFFFIAINGCKKDEPEQEEENNEIELTEINYSVELPNGVSTSAISNFKLSNVYGDYDVQTTANRGTTTNNINSTVKVLDNGSYQINYLINTQGEPVMCGIADIENTTISNYVMSARTTALAMLLSHPLLITTNPTVKNKIEQLIVTLPSFNTYLNDVEGLIQTSIAQQMTPDFTAPVSYKQTVIEVVNSNMENFHLGAPNGMLEVNLQERNNGVLKYTITNHHKRVLHIYPKKVWIDQNTGITTREEAFQEFGFPKIELLPSKGFDFWRSTWAYVSGDDMSIFKVTSDVLEADISAADKLKIEIYGIGKLNTPFSQLTQEEQLKIILVGIHGGFQDYIMPAIDLFLGLKNFEAPEANNQHFDFRYGSKKKPLRQLINNLGIAFSTDVSEMNELNNKLQQRDYVGIIEQFVAFSWDQILGDGQPEAVKRRYLNNIYDIYKNIAGVSSTSEGFRNFIKKGANQISVIKRANFVGQVVSIAELSTNIAGAIYAYYDSDFRNIFYINKVSQTTATLVSPVDNYAVPSGSADLLFDWTFDRGNYIGSISYELIIEEALQNGTTTTHTYQSTSNTYYTVPFSDFDNNSTSFTWKVKVLNTQGNLLIESDVRHFSTIGTVPIVGTAPAIVVSSTSVTSGGNITSDGGSPIIAKGVCYSTSPNPTIADPHTDEGSGSVAFGSTVTGLSPNTTYYLRAYATNSNNTGYGNEEVFTTFNSSSGTFPGQTVLVNGGTFQMGSPSGTGYNNEHPQHSVTISSFQISKYEITNQQYADFLNTIGANADGSVNGVVYIDVIGNTWCQISHNGSSFIVDVGKENYPVVKVSWYGAKAFCEYYNGRLPTEAEWEFAARGGNSSAGYTYSGSNNVDDVAWSSNNSGSAPHTVGTLNANELGLYDMSGNVWELTADWYDSNYYSSSPSNSPQGPSTGTTRVCRGGSCYFTTSHDYCRVANRGYSSDPSSTGIITGFRPVFAP